MEDLGGTDALFQKLVTRSYITYLARIKASERLARLNSAWNIALMLSSVSVTADSVVILVDRTALGPKGDVLLTCASILTLFTSVSVSGMNLSGKSRDMFTSYRRIQRLSAEVERVAQSPSPDDLSRLSSEYDDLLDNSDNHAYCDYLRVKPEERKRWWYGRADVIALLPPTMLGLAAVGLAVPALVWMV